MTAVTGLEALREKANVHGRAEAIAQFRADFALVHRTERAHGWRTEDESRTDIAEAGKVVQAHMHDAEWMARTAAHYAEMAGAIRRDMERSQRIRIEMHAERGQRRAA